MTEELKELEPEPVAEDEAVEEEPAAEETTDSTQAQEIASIGEGAHSAPKKKGKAGKIIHWIIDVILVLIIICLLWLCFSPTGKLVQSYGISETMQGKSSYAGSQWEEAGYSLEDYMYYYDMYAESFEQYKDQYAAMGMESIDDLMDALFQMMQGTYNQDAGGNTEGGDQAQGGEGGQGQ